MAMNNHKKLIKMILLLVSYWVVFYGAYEFTDLLKVPGFKYATFMVIVTTIYTFLLSAIDKGTFGIKFSLLGLIFYVIGVVGFALCAGAGFSSRVAWLVSIVATAFLVTGVVNFNE